MFFSAIFGVVKQPNVPHGRWQDQSTSDCHIFSSVFGTLWLRKRQAYPATFVEVHGRILKAGYGDRKLAEKLLSQTAGETLNGAVYGEEFFLVEIDCAAQTVKLQRDAFCTMPLFAVHSKGKLSISNAYDIACSSFDGKELRVNKSKLYNFIVDRKTDTLDTYLENCLTPAALERVAWTNGMLERSQITLPGHTIHKEYDENPKLFREFLDSLFAEYAEKYVGNQRVGCEFSGGIDSAMVAGYLADNGYAPLLLSEGYTGAFRTSQRQKIQDFKERFRTRHFVVDLDKETLFPLSKIEKDGNMRPFYELEGTYHEADRTLALHLLENGVSVAYNGLGGDDIVARFDFLHKEQFLPFFFTDKFKRYAQVSGPGDPYARTSNQFILQKLGCNNVYLNHGIWPVAPLTDPRLFLYCQALKPRFRDNKNIFRMYCHAWKYPESIYHPLVNENFGAFFNACMELHYKTLAEKWLKHSVLAEAGLLDMRQLVEFTKHMHTDEDYFHFYKLITIESNFQMLGISLEP